MTEQPHYRSYISSHFDLSSLISMARMQSAPRKDSKSFCVPTRDRTRDLSLSGQVLWPLSYRHLVLSCAVLSIYYWITDIHVWDVMHLVMTEQPHYRSYIFVLISTYQVSSAWLECRALQRKIVKVLMCRPGIEPGTSHLPGECSTTELPTPLYYLCSPEHMLLNYDHDFLNFRC